MRLDLLPPVEVRTEPPLLFESRNSLSARRIDPNGDGSWRYTETANQVLRPHSDHDEKRQITLHIPAFKGADNSTRMIDLTTVRINHLGKKKRKEKKKKLKLQDLVNGIPTN
ncbi:hypothetical protein VTI28DRAFT_4990 [Corynascus sepedonium]